MKLPSDHLDQAHDHLTSASAQLRRAVQLLARLERVPDYREEVEVLDARLAHLTQDAAGLLHRLAELERRGLLNG